MVKRVKRELPGRVKCASCGRDIRPARTVYDTWGLCEICKQKAKTKYPKKG